MTEQDNSALAGDALNDWIETIENLPIQQAMQNVNYHELARVLRMVQIAISETAEETLRRTIEP